MRSDHEPNAESARQPDSGPTRLGLREPASARVYDHLLDGKDAYALDRTLAEAVSSQLATAPSHLRPTTVAKANRAFLERAVRYVAGHGIRPWLDIGAGMPHTPNVHELVHETEPDAQVVYLDRDPVVLNHARVHPGVKPGAVSAAMADLSRPQELFALPAVRGVLDGGEPVAILLVAVLHFLPAAEPVMDIVREAMPRGSYLVVSHAEARPEFAEAVELFRTGVGQTPGIPDYTPRAAAQIEALLGGLPLVEPGLVPVNHWRPPVKSDSPPGEGVPLLGAVARKP